MKLKEPLLFRQQAYIDGAWCDADSGATFAVDNPATGEIIGQVPDMGATETQRAIDAANAALPAWSKMSAKARSAILRKWFDLIMANADDLAQLMVLEQGKPFAEAKGEVGYGASFVEWFAEEGKRAYGDVIPTQAPDRRFVVIKQPIGVCAAITPWNFPIAMITRKCAPGLAVGCTFVVKPAEQTPYCALALVALAEQAGMPKGVFNVITCDSSKAPEVGKVLCASPIVKKVTFTGSTEVGRILMRQSADTVKKMGLELGGNASFIVFDDADIDAAVEGAMASKYRNTGQTCVCANRILVQDGVYDAFLEKFLRVIGSAVIGDPLDPTVTFGPVISQSAADRILAAIDEATASGATLLTGGRRMNGSLTSGFYIEPTVLADVDNSSAIAQTETFGPVVSVIRFSDDDEAVRLANDSVYGLNAFIHTRDLARAHRVARQLESGSVWVNTFSDISPQGPYGGYKHSGSGRTGGLEGLQEFLQVKNIRLALA